MPEKKIPSRAMPSTAPAFYDKGTSASGIQEARDTQTSATPSSSGATATPQFNNASFTTSGSGSGSKPDDILSPTEHGSREF
jgi:hypothetical protein